MKNRGPMQNHLRRTANIDYESVLISTIFNCAAV